MDLTLKYDAKADILSIKIREGEIIDEKLLDGDILLGLNRAGDLVALEVWDASKKGLYKTLADLARENKEVIDVILNRPLETLNNQTSTSLVFLLVAVLRILK